MRPILMAAATALALTAPMAANAQMQGQQGTVMTTDAPLLSFSITEEIRSAPDRARVGAGVVTTAPTAVEAMRQNAAAMTRLSAALRRAGIEGRNIQTSGINLSAQYDYTPQQQGQPPRLIGYQVSNMVNVVTSDIANLGRLLDTLVEAGGTNIDGPSFFIDNPDAALDTARQRAMTRATERATLYARAAGYTRGRLTAVSEGGPMPVQPMPVMQMARAESADAATPVQPGQVSNAITLTLQYRLER
ncbi:MAG: SIMPL domain-containing protein [Sphingomonas sp.]